MMITDNNNCKLKQCRKSDLIIISECVSGQLVQLLPKPVDAKVSGQEAKVASQQAKTLEHVDDPVKMAADYGFRLGCYCKFTMRQLKGLEKY